MKKTSFLLSLSFIFLLCINSPVFVSASDFELKEGFVEKNPWLNDFNDIDTQDLELNKIENVEIFSEQEAKEVIEEIKKIQTSDDSIDLINSSNLLIKENNNFMSQAEPLSTKSSYRNQFKAMALHAGTIDLPTAGNYLYHSLQDKPANRTNQVGSSHSNALSLTKMYTSISVPMAKAIDKAKASKKTYAGGTGSFATSITNVGLDFYLTYGKIDYTWGSSKLSSGKWAVNIIITDTYDYQTIKKVSSSFPQKMIDLANNHAAKAQEAGAIVPYKITTSFYQEYKPK